MPYADKEKQNKAMRDINRRARQRKKIEQTPLKEKIKLFQNISAVMRDEWLFLIQERKVTEAILNDTSISDAEKIQRLKTLICEDERNE